MTKRWRKCGANQSNCRVSLPACFFFGLFSSTLIFGVCFSLRLLSYGDGDPSKPHLNLRGIKSTSSCFVLFVLVFAKITSQKLTLPESYLVHLATVLGRLGYEGFFLFLFLTTIDRCFKDGIVA